MTDGVFIARATAIMAANGYVLIRFVDEIQGIVIDPGAEWMFAAATASLVAGIAAGYRMLAVYDGSSSDPEKRSRFWEKLGVITFAALMAVVITSPNNTILERRGTPISERAMDVTPNP